MLNDAVDEPLLLIPPFRFATVEEGVYRGAYPVLRNFPFLETLELKTIVSLTPEPPTYDLKTFAAAHGIAVRHVEVEGYKGEAQLFPTDLNQVLQTLVDVDRHPVLVHCLDGRHITGLVVLALRKLLYWDLNAMLLEYRMFTKEVKDEMAFVGDYSGGFALPEHIPSWLWGGSWLGPDGRPRKHHYLGGLKLKYPSVMTPARDGGSEAGPSGPLESPASGSMPLSDVISGSGTREAATAGPASFPSPQAPLPQICHEEFIDLRRFGHTARLAGGGPPLTSTATHGGAGRAAGGPPPTPAPTTSSAGSGTARHARGEAGSGSSSPQSSASCQQPAVRHGIAHVDAARGVKSNAAYLTAAASALTGKLLTSVAVWRDGDGRGARPHLGGGTSPYGPPGGGPTSVRGSSVGSGGGGTPGPSSVTAAATGPATTSATAAAAQLHHPVPGALGPMPPSLPVPHVGGSTYPLAADLGLFSLRFSSPPYAGTPHSPHQLYLSIGGSTVSRTNSNGSLPSMLQNTLSEAATTSAPLAPEMAPPSSSSARRA